MGLAIGVVMILVFAFFTSPEGGSSSGQLSSLERKCSDFATVKAAAGGTYHLVYSSCLQSGGDSADAWAERQ
jgi:hypothetical protein